MRDFCSGLARKVVFAALLISLCGISPKVRNADVLPGDDVSSPIMSTNPTAFWDPESPVEVEPIIHYLAEDNLGTTNVVDASGNFAGTAARATNLWSTASGKITRGFDFYTGSTQDYIDAAGVNLTDFTFCTWVSAHSDGGNLGLITDSSDDAPRINVNASTDPYTVKFTLGGGNELTSSTISALGSTLTHLCFVRSGTVGLFYKNGVADTSEPNVGTAAITNLRIGNRSSGIAGWDGVLDDMRVYNRPLTANEVAALWAAGSGHQRQTTGATGRAGAIGVDSAGLVGAWLSRGTVAGVEATQSTDAYKAVLTRGDSVENALVQSRGLDLSPWSKTATTVTTGQADPAGGTTAFKIMETSATGLHYVYQEPYGTTDVGTVEFAAIAKAAERTTFTLGFGGYEFSRFNLSNCTVDSSNTNSATAVSLGDGWCYVTTREDLVAGTGRYQYTIYMYDGATYNYTGDPAKGVLIWKTFARRATSSSTLIDTGYGKVLPGLNGHRTLYFDGINDTLRYGNIGNVITVGKKTLVGVVQFVDPSGANQYIAETGSGLYFGARAQTSYLKIDNYDGSGDAIQAAIVSNKPYVFNGTHDGTYLSGFLNGSPTSGVASGNTTTMALDFYLGSNSASASYLNGFLGPVALWSSTLPITVYQPIEKGLAKKYGASISGASSLTSCDNFFTSKTPTMWLRSSDLSTVNKDGSDKVWGWWSRYPYGGAENLLTNSSGIDSWSTWRSSIPSTNIEVCPLDGSNSADLLIEDGTAGSHNVNQAGNVVNGVYYTLSVALKANGRNYGYVQMTGNGFSGDNKVTTVDLRDCSVSSVSGASATGSATSLGGGWCNLSVTAPATATNTMASYVGFSINGNSTTAWTGDSSSGVRICGGHLRETYASPSTYVATTAAAINNVGFSQATAANQPTWIGQGVVMTQAGDSYLSSTSTTDTLFAADAKTIIGILKTGVCNDATCDILRDTNKFGLQVYSTGPVFRAFNNDAGGVDVNAGNSVSNNTLYLIESTHDGVNISTLINGGAASSAASGNTTDLTQALLLGTDGAGTESDLTYLELITDDSVWTADELARARSCLSGYGVTF